MLCLGVKLFEFSVLGSSWTFSRSTSFRLGNIYFHMSLIIFLPALYVFAFFFFGNSFQLIFKLLGLTIYFLKSTVFIFIFLLYFLKDFLSFTIQQSLFDNIKHTLSSCSQNFSPIFGSIRYLHVWSLSELLQAKWSCFPSLYPVAGTVLLSQLQFLHQLSILQKFIGIFCLLLCPFQFSCHFYLFTVILADIWERMGKKNSVQPAMFNWKLALFILFHYFYFPVLIHFQIPLKIVLVIMLTFQWLICFVSQCK